MLIFASLLFSLQDQSLPSEIGVSPEAFRDGKISKDLSQYLSVTKPFVDGKTMWEFTPVGGNQSLAPFVLRRLQLISIAGFMKVDGRSAQFVQTNPNMDREQLKILKQNHQLLMDYANQLGPQNPKWLTVLGAKNGIDSIDLSLNFTLLDYFGSDIGTKFQNFKSSFAFESKSFASIGLIFGGGKDRAAELRMILNTEFSGSTLRLSESNPNFDFLGYTYSISKIRNIEESELKYAFDYSGIYASKPLTYIEFRKSSKAPVLNLKRITQQKDLPFQIESVTPSGDVILSEVISGQPIPPTITFPVIYRVDALSDETKTVYFSNINPKHLEKIGISAIARGHVALKNVPLPE